MELILIRHGLPEKRQTKDGKPADPPLSETGLEQASKMAFSLQNQKIDRIYSSPMQRAMQTAEPLAKLMNMEIEIEEGIAEFDQDSDVYIPVEQLKELDYERWLKLMKGDTEVDFVDFANKVIQSIEKIVLDNRGKSVALACHGGVINVWAAHVLRFNPRLFFNPNYTSINRFMVASSGEKSLITLNEHTHLL